MGSSTKKSISIIVPIYRGYEDTKKCLESVIDSMSEGERLIIINDCSPEDEIVDYCLKFRGKENVVIINNNVNLGYVKSVNKGIHLSERDDVILLNSDTEVYSGWVNRLYAAAYTDSSIGILCPLSNNATILSYPAIDLVNGSIPGFSCSKIDKLISLMSDNNLHDIPTAIGSCMYIKRDCIDEVGLFDEAFGLGYGEENDYSCRALQYGWKISAVTNVYIYHKGSVSFGSEKHKLKEEAKKIIQKKCPEYFNTIDVFMDKAPLKDVFQNIDEHIKSDCEEETKLFIDALRLCQNSQRMDVAEFIDSLGSINSRSPRVLLISHDLGGGVDRYIKDLSVMAKGNIEYFILRGLNSEGIKLSYIDHVTHTESSILLTGIVGDNMATWGKLISALGIKRIHINHIHGWPSEIVSFVTSFNKDIYITAHDYYLSSPNYHLYPEGMKCQDSSWPLEEEFWKAKLEALIMSAKKIIAPSSSVYEYLTQDYPYANIETIPHPQKISKIDYPVKVAILGKLSKEKGGNIVRAMIDICNRKNLNVNFSLIGYSFDDYPDSLHITGSYNDSEIQSLIKSEKPDIFIFPSVVPETFSYTLSYAIAADVYIMAYDIGAFSERLEGYKRCTLLPAGSSADAWVDKIVSAFDVKIISDECLYDSCQQYYDLYCEGMDFESIEAIDFYDLAESIITIPVYKNTGDTTIKDLYVLGVEKKYYPARNELRRRLSLIADTETGVAGEEERNSLLDEVALYKEMIRDKEASLEVYKENLTLAKNNIAEMQDQAGNARKHIAHLEDARLLSDKEIHRLNQELECQKDENIRMVNSLSWKVTRPFRVLVRMSFIFVRASKKIFLLLLKPSVYKKTFMYAFTGKWKIIFNRIGINFKSAVAHAKVLPSSLAQSITPLSVEEFRRAEEIVFPESSCPIISIIIPTFGEHRTTYQCLESIYKNMPSKDFEIILMDDCYLEPAVDALSMVGGIKIIRNEINMGFIGNVNESMKYAKGDYIVLLNNDTIVRDDAIDRLVDTFNEHDAVGLVGAKLLNSDGTLQEAGGIIWKDGSGWNWGRGGDPDDPIFNYVRDVDYCSGAALAFKRELFRLAGGFDTHFAPAYYEDTDFAFRVREMGFRVLYQPGAMIYHMEGVTHGKNELSGIKAYQTTNKAKFYNRWKHILSGHAENGENPESEANRYVKSRILIIDACLITPDQDSGSVRMMNLLKLLKSEGHHVTFVADNLEYKKRYVDLLSSLGVEVLYDHWGGSVRKIIKEKGARYDSIMLCRHYIASQYVSLVRSYAPQAQLIFDTVDLHFVREEREAEISQSRLQKAQATLTKNQELSLVNDCDVSIVVSDFEKKLLEELSPESVVDIVSNIHSSTPLRPGFEARSGIIFVGGFRHTPNIDAITWFVKKVYPHVEKLLPDVTISIIGSNMPDEILNIREKNIEIRGFVENIDSELQSARVSIAPLRYGAGVKGKVNEAMNFGIPVVATTCAIEGMFLTPEKDVLVADNPEEFAQAIARVYEDKALWTSLSVAGIKNIEKYFSPEAALPAVKRIFH